MAVIISFREQRRFLISVSTLWDLSASNIANNWRIYKNNENEHEIENCTVLIPRGISYCRLKRSVKGLGLKSHSKD